MAIRAPDGANNDHYRSDKGKITVLIIRSGWAHLAGKIAGSKLVAPSIENGQGGSVNYSLRYSLLTRQPFTVVLMVCHNQL